MELQKLNARQVQYQSALSAYIEDALYDAKSLQASTTRRITRKALEAIAMIVVVGARVGIVMINLTGSAFILELPISHPATLSMSLSNCIGTVVSFGFLSAISKLMLIEEITSYVSPQEAHLTSEKVSICMMTIIKVVAVLAGIFAQFPVGYGAYKSALVARRFIGTLTFLDFGRASYSTYMSLRRFVCYEKPKTGTDKKLVHARTVMTKKVSAYQKKLIAGSSNKTSFSFEEFKEDVLQCTLPIEEAKSLSKRLKNCVEVCIGFIVLSVLAQFNEIAKDGAKNVIKENGLVVAIGIFVVLANSHLWYTVIRNATFLTINYLKGDFSPSMTQKLMPHFYRRFTRIGVFLAIPTFVPSVYFTKLFFPKYAFYPIATLASVGTFLAGLSSLCGLRDIIIRRWKKNHPLALANEKLEKISATISQTNIHEIAEFLKELSEDIRTSITDLKEEQLSAYYDDSEKSSLKKGKLLLSSRVKTDKVPV